MTEEQKKEDTGEKGKGPHPDTVFGACALSCAFVALLVFVGVLWKFTKWAFF